jgi:hypothetical protein
MDFQIVVALFYSFLNITFYCLIWLSQTAVPLFYKPSNIISPLFYSFPKQNPTTVVGVYQQRVAPCSTTLHQLMSMDYRIRVVLIVEICWLVPFTKARKAKINIIQQILSQNRKLVVKEPSFIFPKWMPRLMRERATKTP